jgi:hypothetical protein
MSADVLRSHAGSLHAVRVRRFRLAAAAYVVCLPLLLAAHLLNIVSLKIVLQLGGAMVAVNAALYMLFHTGLNERFKDPSLTWLQTLLATGVLRYGVYHFDQERALALTLCLVFLSFGTFQHARFLAAAGIVLAGYALVSTS